MKNVWFILFFLVAGIASGFILGSVRFYAYPRVYAYPYLDAHGNSVSQHPKTNETPLNTSDAHSEQTLVGQPLIEVQRIHDFGILTEGNQKAQCVFHIKNVGNAPLTVEVSSSTCRCTVPDLKKNTLAPGESVPLKVSFNGHDMVGTFTQTVTLATNDALNTEVPLTIKGILSVELRVKDPELSMGRILEKDSAQTDTTLYSYTDTPLNITDIKATYPASAEFFSTELVDLTPEEVSLEPGAKSGKRLIIRLKPGLPQGAFQQNFILTTNSVKRNSLDVHISGVIGDQISIHGRGWNEEQSVLTLDRVERGKKYSQTLYIIARGKDYLDFKFSLGDQHPPFLLVHLSDTQELQDTKVTRTALSITIPPDAPAVNYWTENIQDMGTIILNTGENRTPLKIYLRFAVIPK